MVPGSADLTCRQGDTFSVELLVADDGTPPTGTATWTVAAQVRRVSADADATVGLVAPLLALTATHVEAGRWVLSATGDQTRLVPAGVWRWDVDVKDAGGKTVTAFEGDWTCVAEVTRPLPVVEEAPAGQWVQL